MTNKKILTIIFFIIIFFLSTYISGIYSILGIVFSLFIYSILTYILYGVYKILTDKTYIFFSKQNYKYFLTEFLYRTSSLVIAFIFIIGSFSYYQNEISPAKMPTFTLTNGDKIVVFQTMSHIGTQKFFELVKQNISDLKSEGFVLYFEGVKPGTKENHEAFDKALGVKFDNTTYENMSKLYGLTNQDNQMFLNLVNDKDYNVDVSIDEIMGKYNELKIKSGNQNRVYSEPIDASKIVINELAKLRENELKVLRYINKSFINMIVKSEGIQKTIQNNFANKELFDVILNNRNEIIAEKVINSEDKKIVMTYGMLHFDGIYNILKQNDIKWHITKIDYLYPIK